MDRLIYMYKERLKKLIHFFRRLPPNLFDMHYYVNCRPSKLAELYELDKRCGGTADPIGWLSHVFPDDFYCDDTCHFKDGIHVPRCVKGTELWDRLNAFFGLDDYYLSKLFTVDGYKKRRVTPKDVAAKIADFIKYEL